METKKVTNAGLPSFEKDTKTQRGKVIDKAKIREIRNAVESQGSAIRFRAQDLADYLGLNLPKSIHALIWNLNKKPEIKESGLKFGLRNAGEYIAVTIKELM